jgi:golgi-specific brefeldin A-resistance guanine nucleotide exchange factor 1
MTWQRIGVFLPNLKDELFKEPSVAPVVHPVAAGPVLEQPAPPPTFVPQEVVAPQPLAPPPPPPQVIHLETPIQSLPTSSTVPMSNWSPQNQPPIWMMTPEQQQENRLLFSSTGQPVPIFYPSVAAPVLTPVADPPQSHEQSNIIELPVTPSPPESPAKQTSPQSHSEQTSSAQSSPFHVPSVMAEPSVPISHLMMENHYPSLKGKVVPLGIAQSFTPVCVQPVQATASPPNGTGSEIYSDYVQNPYNLTLQAAMPDPQPLLEEVRPETAAAPTPPTAANVFQSANYFGASSNPMPPGSEVLFGGSPFDY